MIHSYHMSKPAKSSFTKYVIDAVLSSSDSDIFICYSVLPGNAQDAPLPSVMSSVQSLVSVAVRGHTSELYGRVDRIIASYNLMFTLKLIHSHTHLFFHIFLIFPKYCCCFPDPNADVLFTAATVHAKCSYQGSRSQLA